MTQAAQRAGTTLQPRIHVSSVECMCSLVQVGRGIMPLPERVLATYTSAGRPPSANCFGRHIWSPQYGQVWKVDSTTGLYWSPGIPTPDTSALGGSRHRPGDHEL